MPRAGSTGRVPVDSTTVRAAERAVNRLKGFRAVATRYEKRARIWLRT